MLPEIEHFARWLRRKAPYSSTHIHYTNDWNCSSPGLANMR
jgi:hypothetical protein